MMFITKPINTKGSNNENQIFETQNVVTLNFVSHRLQLA